MQIPKTRIEVINFILFIEGELLKEGVSRANILEARDDAKKRGLDSKTSDLSELIEEAQSYQNWLENRRKFLRKL